MAVPEVMPLSSCSNHFLPPRGSVRFTDASGMGWCFVSALCVVQVKHGQSVCLRLVASQGAGVWQSVTMRGTKFFASLPADLGMENGMPTAVGLP